ncbi:unnamed protein product [Tenebrio molitor]|nr:unnamed protein product [Tenebrio molitor]
MPHSLLQCGSAAERHHTIIAIVFFALTALMVTVQAHPDSELSEDELAQMMEDLYGFTRKQ